MLATGQVRNEEQAAGADEERARAIFDEVKQTLIERLHVPSSTYRVQFNRFFTFEQAVEQVEYLQRLGISDLYASPYFKAGPDSLHGYDIANHNELNPSIGTPQEYDAMVERLHRAGMRQVLDTVPNHMGIGEEGNSWWMDVLENGRASIYAPYFDIDWDPINTKLTGKVLLPVLGAQYGQALENKELQISFLPEQGRFVLCYYDKSFPVNPRTYVDILGLDKDRLVEELGSESEPALEYQSILTALDHLPPRSSTDPQKVLERNREKEIIKRRIAALCAAEPRVLQHIGRDVRIINGVEGDPDSFDRLDALIEQQSYRLSFWRVATEEINYRRFFDVNNLAAVRVEEPRVFRDTHRLVMQLLGDGKLNGLRIDHIDGLRDPAGYLEDLQRAYFLALCRECASRMAPEASEPDTQALDDLLLEMYEAERATDPQSVLVKPLYVVVEKILGRGESLPPGWATYGTTGYEFNNAVNGLFLDSANQKAFDEIYAAFVGEKIKFADLVYKSKQQIMRLSLASEVNVLTNMLTRITQNDRHSRDFTMSTIRNGIREVIACFPVYRTYVTSSDPTVDKRDQGYIETALSRAIKRNPAMDPSIFHFLRDTLLLRGYEGWSEEAREARLNFVTKFQQVTGPVTAKGLEDTAFYIYNRLISLNEVGGEPGYFGISLAAFHQQQAERQRNWPHSILTTSTHDTKRSEDVRARIDVISELPKEWRTAARRWARVNRKLKKSIDGQPAPGPNEEYFLYQTLLGVWPFKEDIPEKEYTELMERVQTYMRKALNEAKVNSSWINPNEPYQEAVAGFIEGIMRRGEDNRFLPDFLGFQRKIAFYGAFNSLSQVLLKIAGPGVPDIYQGTEIWDFSLVDPDNRRPVDYALRRRLLSEVDEIRDAQGAAALLDTPEDGRIKLFVTSRALRYRRDNFALFAQGAYKPLEAQGKQSESLVAFSRSFEERVVIAVASRLVTRLGKSGELTMPFGAAWAGAWLVLPGAAEGDMFRNIFTGEELAARKQGDTVGLPVEEVLRVFPLALLERIAPNG